ncbi:uncharacterized protein IAS62_004286 [Cryptococcus decagattii]|uniref:Uncharacterized protein n=1 Tax=Cryptococcus decagattii TaxID=1859122 RepID=A0ABZ2AWN0_9TREE
MQGLQLHWYDLFQYPGLGRDLKDGINAMRKEEDERRTPMEQTHSQCASFSLPLLIIGEGPMPREEKHQ